MAPRARTSNIRPPSAAKKAGRPSYTFRAVTRRTWKDLDRLFEDRGGPKSCWCMVWRATAEETRRTDGASRKAFLKKRVDAGVPIGILAYLGGEPVAWCSIAPRETYRKGLANVSGDDASGGVWSLVCFFAKRSVRGSGIIHALVGAAKAYAKKAGGRLVEAYPVDPDSPSYRFMGFVPTIAAEGFVPIGKVGTRRHVYRCSLR